MRWEDERWVKLYTRDTGDWLLLSFEAQGLFRLLLTKVDGAGILHLGRAGRRAVAGIVGHPHRWDLIEPALEELIQDGCVVLQGERLIMPNYLEAQEAKTSDKEKKRRQRERDRADALADGFVGSKAGADIVAAMGRLGSHRMSPDVTTGVTGSHQEVSPDVTGCHQPEEKRQDQNRREEDLSSASPPPMEPEGSDPEPVPLLTPEDARATDAVEEVIDHYLKAMRANGKRTRPTDKRRKLIRARLKDGFSVAELKLAVSGLTWSDWHMGRDPKTNGATFTDIKYALRDAETVEAMIERVPKEHRGAA